MCKSLSRVATAAALLLGAVTSANAVVYTFNANLSGASELPSPSTSVATGVATLVYDSADNTYDFSLAVFGLSGGMVAGTAASAFHIHGAANTSENGPVRVGLDASPFVNLNIGSTLLVGGNGVAAPAIPATAVSGLNQGYAAMSFLQLLQGGLAYVNVHTVASPAGAVRGQLLQVSVVPEPSVYAMLLAGIGMVGFMARRRLR